MASAAPARIAGRAASVSAVEKIEVIDRRGVVRIVEVSSGTRSAMCRGVVEFLAVRKPASNVGDDLSKTIRDAHLRWRGGGGLRRG